MSESEAKTKKDAIIFIPGLLDMEADQTIDTAVERLRLALRSQFAAKQTGMSLEFDTENLGDSFISPSSSQSFKTSSRRIVYSVTDPAQRSSKSLLDFYYFDYMAEINRTSVSSTLLGKIVSLSLTIAALMPRAIRSLFRWRSTTSIGRRAQLIYGVMVLSVLLIYAASLVAGLVGSVYMVGQNGVPATQPAVATDKLFAEPAKKGHWREVVGSYFDWISPNTAASFSALTAIAITSAGALLPDLNKRLVGAATQYVFMLRYISDREHNNQLLGLLALMVRHVAIDRNEDYDRIILVGYSFGSILAVDYIFAEEEPRKTADLVDCVVTLAFPHDMICAFWPAYFVRRTNPRRGLDSSPQAIRWINIYNPEDILSSNFRRDEKAEDQAELTLAAKDGYSIPKPKNILFGRNPDVVGGWGVGQAIRLNGIRSHTRYWSKEAATDFAVFEKIASVLYQSSDSVGISKVE